MIAEGYSASQTLSQLHDRLVSMETLSDKQKSVVAEKMGVSYNMYFSTWDKVSWNLEIMCGYNYDEKAT